MVVVAITRDGARSLSVSVTVRSVSISVTVAMVMMVVVVGGAWRMGVVCLGF